MHKYLISIFPLFLLCAGCGGGGGNPTGIIPENCTVQGQNRFVYDVMQDLYLYYDQLPMLNPDEYSSPRALLEDLRVAPDRFSAIADRQTQQNFFQAGTYNGIGFSFKNNGDSFTVTFVYDDSSAGREGLQRGDQILSIAGNSVSQINDLGGLSTFLDNYDDNQPLNFSIVSTNEQAFDLVLSKNLVKINTVLSAEVITNNNLNVGYLALSSFIEPTKAELALAFNRFKQENIDELVLDLRYNSGGRIDTAQRLASHIAGEKALGADVAKILYNNKNTNLNDNFPFQSLLDSIDIERLYVLTLDGTCSASELVINAMNPVGIEVITIGQSTCGKPIGFRNINFCDKTLSPASFDIVNEINQGGYFAGIEASCEANDDLTSLLADPNEGMLAAALYHIENDQCSVAAKASDRSAKSKQKQRINIMESVF